MIARLFASALLNTSRNTPVEARSAGISVLARQPPLAYSSKLSPGFTFLSSPLRSTPSSLPAACCSAAALLLPPEWTVQAVVASRAADRKIGRASWRGRGAGWEGEGG